MTLNRDLKNQWINWDTAAFLALLAAFFVILQITRPTPPPVGKINGTFRNPCCEEIILKDGQAIFGGKRISFRLERDKNGHLVARLQKRLYVAGDHIAVADDPDGAFLLFEMDHGGFDLSRIEAPNAFDMPFVRVAA